MFHTGGRVPWDLCFIQGEGTSVSYRGEGTLEPVFHTGGRAPWDQCFIQGKGTLGPVFHTGGRVPWNQCFIQGEGHSGTSVSYRREGALGGWDQCFIQRVECHWTSHSKFEFSPLPYILTPK